jgi:hypothetical protein
MTAATTSPDFDGISGREILGVTLERKLSGRARETHVLRAHLRMRPSRFDGGCRTMATEGAFNGSLRVRFSVWGGRTFGAAPTRDRLTAMYRVTTPA